MFTNEIDSEDITIESFAKAFNKISSFDSKYEFKTWLITISKNLHIDKVRKNKNKIGINEFNEKISLQENSPSPEDKLINEQKLISLKSKINKLKPHYKEVIELRFFNELTYKEISSKLNQPIRIAMTGSTQSPSLGLTLSLFELAEVNNRIDAALEYLANST